MIAQRGDRIGAPRLSSNDSASLTLSYVADIVSELEQLVDKAGHKTLAAILGAAAVEARIRYEESKR